MLTAEGIYKRYNRKEILKGVDLTVAPGECVVIVGSNGCGKTTLLSILAGALKADKGRVSLDGKEISKSPADHARAVDYVPQENPLMEELTVRDNLLLWYGGDKKAMERDLTEHAANVYIQDLADLVAVRKGLEGVQFYPIYVLDLSSVRWAQ